MRRLGQAPDELGRTAGLERAGEAAQARLERLALDPLHRVVAGVVSDVLLVDRDDPRVVEPRGGARLALEADPGRLEEPRTGEDLERDLALESGLPGQVDDAHPPAAELADDSILAERLEPSTRARYRSGDAVVDEEGLPGLDRSRVRRVEPGPGEFALAGARPFAPAGRAELRVHERQSSRERLPNRSPIRYARSMASRFLLFLALGCGAVAQDEGLESWIARLSDPDFETREAATGHLLRAGEDARPALEALLATGDPEIEHRVRFLLENLGNLLADPGAAISTGGSAVLEGGRLVLTPAAGGTGGAFLTRDLGPGSFRTSFRFRIADPSGMWDADGVQGADGMAFVLATDPEALGEGGGGMGWVGLAPAVVVEFDTYQNGGDLDGNHAAIHVHSRPEPLASAHVDPALNERGEWWAWIDHDAREDRLELRLARTADRPARSFLAAEVDLAAIFGESPVHMGFTAATGGAANSHAVEFWRLEATR